MPTSTPLSSGSFKSVMGVDRRSASSTIFKMRSSISSRDIWHPAQPQIQSEAIFGLFISSSIQGYTGFATMDGLLPVRFKRDVHARCKFTQYRQVVMHTFGSYENFLCFLHT